MFEMGEELFWKSNSTLVSALPGCKTLFSSCFDLSWGPVYTVLKAFCNVTTVKNYVDEDLKVKTHLTLYHYYKKTPNPKASEWQREENRNTIERILWLFLNINKYIAIAFDLEEQEGQNNVTLII